MLLIPAVVWALYMTCNVQLAELSLRCSWGWSNYWALQQSSDLATNGANIQPSLEPSIQHGDRTASLSSGIASEAFTGASKIL